MTENSRPKVSVVVPVYDVENFLPACLDAILAQTLSDFECLCVYTPCNDNSLAVLEGYAARDSRIRILQTPGHKWQAWARNMGMDAARGETLRLVDSDDLIPADSLETLYTTLKQSGARCVRGSYTRNDAHGKSYLVEPETEGMVDVKTTAPEIMHSVLCAHWSYLFYTDDLNRLQLRYKGDMRDGEDIDFLYRVFFALGQVYVVRKSVYSYIYHSNSAMTRSMDKAYFLNIFSLDDTLFSLAGQSGRQDIAMSRFLAQMHGYYRDFIFKTMMKLPQADCVSLMGALGAILKRASFVDALETSGQKYIYDSLEPEWRTFVDNLASEKAQDCYAFLQEFYQKVAVSNDFNE